MVPRLLPNLEAYRSGKFSHAAKTACDDPDAIREIIERVSGQGASINMVSMAAPDSKGSLDGLTITGYAYPMVHWTDAHGVSGSSNIEKGEGKLPGDLTGLQNGVSTPSPASLLAKTTAQRVARTTRGRKSLACSDMNRLLRSRTNGSASKAKGPCRLPPATRLDQWRPCAWFRRKFFVS